jgi:enterochelin esterase family protein
MGGAHTIAITNNNPGMFGWIGVFSYGTQPDDAFRDALRKVKEGGVKYYWLGAGTTDFLRDQTIALSQATKDLGFNTSYHEAEGGHYWFIWRQFLSEYTPMLFK